MSFELIPLPTTRTDMASIPVMQLCGDIDVTNAAALQQALTKHTNGALIVDLGCVGYFDSAGFAVLDRLLSRGRLAVVAPPGSVVRPAIALMDLPFHDTIDAAEAFLRR